MVLYEIDEIIDINMRKVIFILLFLVHTVYDAVGVILIFINVKDK